MAELANSCTPNMMRESRVTEGPLYCNDPLSTWQYPLAEAGCVCGSALTGTAM